MSFSVVRGAPTAGQRCVDAALAAAGAALGLDPRLVSMPQLMLHCMRAKPEHVFMTNGATGVKTTNRAMLSTAIPLARALLAARLAGRRAMVAVRDHERAVAVYLALNFAGVVPFMTDPQSTPFELGYYMDLVEPAIVFSDAATHASVLEAVAGRDDQPLVMAVHTDQLLDYIKGFEDNIDDFRVADSSPDSVLMMLPTSGSTGMPKAALYHNRGEIEQLAGTWMHHEQFPGPTQRAMILTTPQWATFTMLVTSSVVFHVELLMSPELPTVAHVLHMMETYKPTWTFLGPAFALQLAREAAPRHFASLQVVLTLGSQASPALHSALKALMPATSSVCDGYGMTEAHGFITKSAPGDPLGCNGPVNNILHYKIVKENGEVAAIGEEGELYVKGECLIKGYYKNESELAASMADGWLRTGDSFVEDGSGRLYYRRRIKFSFKYNNQLVSPEELEGLVCSLASVAECGVCDSPRGPAAAVVLRARTSPDDARREIHQLIDSTLSDHKRLRGGIAVVASLPRTHTGKLHRGRCRDLVHQLIADGSCC